MTRKTTEPRIGKYIDPMVDYGFKYIFKESGKKLLLIRPLNEIFRLNIVDITIDDSEQLGHTQEDRKACFDLFCKTEDGRQFVIEVQIAQQKYFLERALFYTTFPISKAAPKDKDEREKWDFNYPPVFLFILKNLPNFAEKPELWDDPYFEAMIQEAEYANMSDAQQMAYLRSLMARWDYANTIDFAREEGREEGETNKAVEVARRMLAEGFDTETIARLTDLGEEQITAL